MTISTKTKVEVVDSLALLALKVAPNIFDISTGQYHVSIRDQIARAQLLIRDLARADDDFGALLIIGGSAAGVAAAIAAARLGKQVLVVDTRPAPFALQTAATARYVGPFMYEWPSIVSQDQSYPPVDKELWAGNPPGTSMWTARRPMAANDLAKSLQAWLAKSVSDLGAHAPSFLYGVRAQYTRGYIKDFRDLAALNAERRMMRKPLEKLPRYDTDRASKTGSPDTRGWGSFVPDYIVLAAGMGAEETTLRYPAGCRKWMVKGAPFWGIDKLRLASADAHIGVCGGGDGALQDVLRALTVFEHPLDMLDFLNMDKDVKRAINAELPKLSAIEAQSRLMTTWTLDRAAYEEVDQLCRQVALRLARHARVCARVAKSIRRGRGTVRHFVAESYFSKTYLLNRFMVHLIDSCQSSKAWKGGRMRYRLMMDCRVDWAVNRRPPVKDYLVKVTHKGLPAQYFLDEVAVRFGLKQGSAPGMQMVKLSHHDSGQRSSLSHVPMTFVVPD